MTMARDMHKNVSSISQSNLLVPPSTSHSSHTKQEDKSSQSMNVDPSPSSIHSLITTMQQFMKYITTMMQAMHEDRNRSKEYP